MKKTPGVLAANVGVALLITVALVAIAASFEAFSRIHEVAVARHDTEFQSGMHVLFAVIIAGGISTLLLALSLVYVMYREARLQSRDSALREAQHSLDIRGDLNNQLVAANLTLLMSEERLAVTLNSIGDGVIAADAQGRVTILNLVAEKLTGWSQVEAQGHSVDDILHILNQVTRQPSVLPIKKALELGTVQGLANHSILISRTGSECAIADSCAPIRNRDGQVVGAVLVFRDVTESYAAMEYAENVVNTVREPLITLDQDLRVVSASRSFYDVFEVRPEETVGRLIYDLGNRQWDIPQLRELLGVILSRDTTIENYEVEHDFAAIGRRVMLLNARQLQRVFGRERIILLAIEDITERRRVEDDLKRVQRELEGIVKVQEVIIADTTQSLDLETESRRLEEIEVLHRHEALETVYAMGSISDYSMESLYDQVVQSIAETLSAPSVSLKEYRSGKIARGSRYIDNSVSREAPHPTPCVACQLIMSNKDSRQISGDLGSEIGAGLCFDTSRFHSFAGVPIRNEEGVVLGMIDVLDDAERTFSEPEIKFVETFARYVAHVLSRRDLESRLRRGEELRMLGQLTAGVAHEVRNPLNGIMAIMAGLSKEFSTSSTIELYLTHMRNQVSRLKVLMDDLLDFGRPMRKDKMQEIALIQLVKSSIAQWLQTIKEHPREMVFETSPDADSYIVNIETVRVTQMIVNLLENADHHSPAGAPIAVSIRGSGETHGVLIVKDLGTGILPENLPRIFEPFFTSRVGGVGLGLSIVRTIAENHQGCVTAYNNTDGPGASFEVVLPIVRRGAAKTEACLF